MEIKPILGRDVILALCPQLGLDPKVVYGIEIRAFVNEPAFVTIYQFGDERIINTTLEDLLNAVREK